MMLEIKAIIKREGYTVTSVAEKMGMTQVSLSRIINGNPTVETLEKIANVLNVDIGEFFIPLKSTKEPIYVRRGDKYVAVGEIEEIRTI